MWEGVRQEPPICWGFSTRAVCDAPLYSHVTLHILALPWWWRATPIPQDQSGGSFATTRLGIRRGSPYDTAFEGAAVVIVVVMCWGSEHAWRWDRLRQQLTISMK